MVDSVQISDVMLFSDGGDVVVEVKIDGKPVEIIRTCQDANISHGIGANGIVHCCQRQLIERLTKERVIFTARSRTVSMDEAREMFPDSEAK